MGLGISLWTHQVNLPHPSMLRDREGSKSSITSVPDLRYDALACQHIHNNSQILVSVHSNKSSLEDATQSVEGLTMMALADRCAPFV